MKTKQQIIEAQLNDKAFLEQLEEVAMQLLRPNFPVISVKKLKNAVREALLERDASFIQANEGKQIDPDDLRELVFSLISKLQRDVYIENRIALYNQDGIGLNFAIEQGAQGYLNQGQYAFYYNLFVQKDNPDDSSSSSQKSETRAAAKQLAHTESSGDLASLDE